MKRRVLAIALSAALALSLAVPALAVEDLSGHWAKEALETWQGYGVLQGDDNGDLRPDSSITRGEMAVILDRVMEYQAQSANTFTDLNDSWYTEAILGANAAGIIQGYEDGSVKPAATITRQEAAVMFARVLGLDTDNAPEAGFLDRDEIASWAIGAVNAMAAAGYIQGSNGKFNPAKGITRAEVVTILNNVFAGYYSEAGEYTGDVDGSAVINAGDVTLKDMSITGDLIVAEGVADGHVVLDSVTVGGKLIVRGGGENSIIITGDSKIGTISVARRDGIVRVSVEGNATVTAIVVDENADTVKVEGTVTTVTVVGAGAAVEVTGTVGTVTVAETAASAEVTVAADAKVDTVTASAASASVVVSGTVETVEVGETATAAAVTVAQGGEVGTVTTTAASVAVVVSGTVETVNVGGDSTTVTAGATAKIDTVTTSAANTTVTGEGKVTNVEATATATGAAVTTIGTKVENNSSDVVTTNNGTVNAGTTGTTTGGSSSSNTGTGTTGGGTVTVPTVSTTATVTTLEQLTAALSDSNIKTITVSGAIEVGNTTVTIPEGKVVQLDANGSLKLAAVSSDTATAVAESKLEVNGTLKGTATQATNDKGSSLAVKTGGSVIIKGTTDGGLVTDITGETATVTNSGNWTLTDKLTLNIFPLSAMTGTGKVSVYAGGKLCQGTDPSNNGLVWIGQGGALVPGTDGHVEFYSSGANLKNDVYGTVASGRDFTIVKVDGVVTEQLNVMPGATMTIGHTVALAGEINVSADGTLNLNAAPTGDGTITGVSYTSKLVVGTNVQYGNLIAGTYTYGESGWVSAVENVLKQALNYQYTGEGTSYTYTNTPEVDGTTVTYSATVAEYTTTPAHGSDPDSTKVATADLARFLGAIYRFDNGASVQTITYNDTDYTWNADVGLEGSNWAATGTENTLIGAVVGSLPGDFATNGATFTFTVNGTETVTLKLNISA